MDQVDVAGLRIGYQLAGSGPPLVLLHGAVCDSRVWREQIEALSDEFTVVAWDAPGCGTSSDPPEAFGLGDYADCLAGFISAVGLRRPHVLGHSFGGGLALALYGKHPAAPASLVLVGAYAGWAGSLPDDEVRERLRLALALAEQVPMRVTPASLPGLASETTPAEWWDEMTTIMADVRPAGTRGMARALAEADLRDVLPRVAVPTLLVHGEVDVRAPRYVVDALHRSIPTSTLVTLPGAGHEVYADSPQAFTAEVRAFLHGVG